MFAQLGTLTGIDAQPGSAAAQDLVNSSGARLQPGRNARSGPASALHGSRMTPINERKMKIMRRTTAVAALAVIALAAAGCSSSSSSSPSSGSTSGGGNTVDIYSSLPLQGGSSAQTLPMVNGMKLALAQANNKAGQWTVSYQSLDDSTAAAGKWDPGQTAADARQAASDPKAVYYMGEFNSGASEVSIPILNQAGI